MKRETYMSKNELLDFLKVGIFAGEAGAIADRTPEKDWARKLKCIATYAKKITDERLAVLDLKQLQTVKRREKHTEMLLFTSDQRRMNKQNDGSIESSITLATQDLYDIVDLAMLSCLKCPQGEFRKKCHWREVYHRLGVPPLRTAPKDGECEFRWDNEQRAVTPEYAVMEMAEEKKIERI